MQSDSDRRPFGDVSVAAPGVVTGLVSAAEVDVHDFDLDSVRLVSESVSRLDDSVKVGDVIGTGLI